MVLGAMTADEARPAPATNELALYRPTPNPFEHTVRFAYAVARNDERVEIGMYDVAGRRVRTLATGAQSAGRYEVSWDGRADDGVRTQAGVYFLRSAVGSNSQVVRVVYLMK